MPGIRPRAAWMAGVLSAVTAAGLLTGGPANAVVGTPLNDSYAFTAQLDLDNGKRSCSGVLVEQQWVATAASCFVDNPAQGIQVPAGKPALPTTATIGRVDADHQTGTTVDVVELVPRTDRDLVMARLAKPVTGIAPIGLSSSLLVPGEDLRVTGAGRTKEEWVPQRLHTAMFTAGEVKDGTVALSAKSDSAAICQGDTGGPAFRDINGRYELVGIHSRSWQGGCLGTDPAETRTGAVDARTDDIAGWIQAVASRTLLARANWANAGYMASGHFTNNGASDSKRRMDLFVVWKDGSASLYQGADHDDPKYPFTIEYKIAGAGSTWKYARAITGGNFAGTGSDGLFVKWTDGEVTEYAHLDQNGVHGEKKLVKGVNEDPKNYWKNAKLVAAGRFTPNSQRDDVITLWEDGSTSMYTNIDAKGVSAHTQLGKDGWTAAAQITAGEFTGKGTADLLIRWTDGQTTIFPGVDAKGFHNSRINIRPEKSAWANAEILTTGAFAIAGARPNDILIRWSNGPLSYYPGVDAKGTHSEIQLVG